MVSEPREKNETTVLTVVRGDAPLPAQRGRRRGRRPGPTVLTPAERELERMLRDLFVVMKTPDGVTPSRGVYNICADAAHPWRAIARRVLEAIDSGCASERVRAIGEAFLAWIDRRLAERSARGDDGTRGAA